MFALLKQNRLPALLLAGGSLLACFGCAVIIGLATLTAGQNSSGSELLQQSPATTVVETVAPLAVEATATLTSPTAMPSTETGPVARESASPATVPDQARRAYMPLMLLEGSMVMLEESAQLAQSDQSDGFETLGRVMGIGIILKATEEALQQPAPDPAMQPAWEAAQEAVPLIQDAVKRWVDQAITASEVALALEPAREKLSEALNLSDEVMAGYGVDPAQLAQLRQEAMTQLRENMANSTGDAEPPGAAEAAPGADETAAETEATVPALEILSMSDYVDSIDYLHIVGEIQNISETPYEFVQVVVTLYDEAGVVIDTEFTYTDLDVVRPGQIAPFKVSTNQYANVVEYKAQVQGRPADTLPYEGLKIANTSDYVDDIGYHHLVGEVLNEGQAVVEFVQIVATLYNETGEVVGAEFTYADLDTVPPGGSAPFEVTVSEEVQFAEYLLQVQGRPVE